MTDRDLGAIIEKLRTAYGLLASPYVTDAFEMILYENVAYLVDDEHRVEAFENLRREIGVRPEDILTASPEQFRSLAERAGSNKQGQIDKLIRSAEIVLKDFDGDLKNALKLPLKKAVAAIKKFPSIGEPGAEKILLFTRTFRIFALESNGLRVLVRVGFGEEQNNYSAIYRSVQNAVVDQIPNDFDWLIETYQLLRKHGQTICKRTAPMCDRCVLRSCCEYASRKH
jgi:endonuclease III